MLRLLANLATLVVTNVVRDRSADVTEIQLATSDEEVLEAIWQRYALEAMEPGQGPEDLDWRLGTVQKQSRRIDFNLGPNTMTYYKLKDLTSWKEVAVFLETLPPEYNLVISVMRDWSSDTAQIHLGSSEEWVFEAIRERYELEADEPAWWKNDSEGRWGRKNGDDNFPHDESQEKGSG